MVEILLPGILKTGKKERKKAFKLGTSAYRSNRRFDRLLSVRKSNDVAVSPRCNDSRFRPTSLRYQSPVWKLTSQRAQEWRAVAVAQIRSRHPNQAANKTVTAALHNAMAWRNRCCVVRRGRQFKNTKANLPWRTHAQSPKRAPPNCHRDK